MELIAHRAAAGEVARISDADALTRALAGPAGRVELDVVAHRGRLVVAHDPRDATRPGRIPLDEALALIAASDRRLLADIKGPRVARPLADALVAHRLTARTIVCGRLDSVELACRASGATPAWTLPTPARRPLAAPLARVLARPLRPDDAHPPRPATRNPVPATPPHAPAGPFGRATGRSRRRLELAAVDALLRGRCSAVCVERRFVGPGLAAAVHAHGGRLLVWTVDDPADARRLAGLGVDALITNDPGRLAASIA